MLFSATIKFYRDIIISGWWQLVCFIVSLLMLFFSGTEWHCRILQGQHWAWQNGVSFWWVQSHCTHWTWGSEVTRIYPVCVCVMHVSVYFIDLGSDFWPYWPLLKTECFCCSVHDVRVTWVMSNWNTGRKAKHGEGRMKKVSVTLTIYKISIKSNWCL